MLSGRKDRRELLETLRTKKNDSVAMSHRSQRQREEERLWIWWVLSDQQLPQSRGAGIVAEREKG